MSTKLNLKAVSLTLLIAGVVSYILCITGDVLFNWSMYQVWTPLLPGFTWPVTTGGFLIGLVWLALYSLYGAA